MKHYLVTGLVAALMTMTANAANIVYTSSHAVGGGSVNLSITTDGTIGALTVANIIDWTIGITDGTTATLFGPLSGSSNSHLVMSGAPLSASATDLSFNAAAGGGNFALFQTLLPPTGGPYYCVQATATGCFDLTGTAGEGINPVDGKLDQRNVLEGTVVIASTSGAQVPEPTTLSMLALGMGALVAKARSNRRTI